MLLCCTDTKEDEVAIQVDLEEKRDVTQQGQVEEVRIYAVSPVRNSRDISGMKWDVSCGEGGGQRSLLYFTLRDSIVVDEERRKHLFCNNCILLWYCYPQQLKEGSVSDRPHPSEVS